MSFFKAYDMRGTYGVDFDPETVRKVGFCLPKVIPGKRWLVGRDCRLTSDQVHDALVSGLLAAGVEVTDLGLSTTSMVYYFTGEDDFDGSVMITASHNPPTDNGLKVSKKTALPVGYADGLNEVETLIGEVLKAPPQEPPQVLLRKLASPSLGLSATSPFAPHAPFASSSASTEYHKRYLDYLRSKLNTLTSTLANLRFAIDCSNGMSSLFVRDLFPNAIILNETRDGNFPAHSPNPLKAEARAQLAAVVREKGLDCGVIFDGDADRAMFVDERGEFVQPDYLIPIVAKATIGSVKGKTISDKCRKVKVLHDIRTSRSAIETLREMGLEPVMVPVGHAFAKPILREVGAACGGELAGHYYFAEFHGCDSGLLAAIRVLSQVAEAKAEGKSFSELMHPIVSRYANSGELNYKVEDKDTAIARVLSLAATFAPETGRSEIDGVRLEFEDGWINVRKSNTEPYLRLLVEHREPAGLKQWVEKIESAILQP